jgi:hypothetical protein
MSNTSVESPKKSGAAPPNDFDPALLGPRQVAGWAVPFDIKREQQSHTHDDYRYRETVLATCFDDDLRERAPFVRCCSSTHSAYRADR